jgi:hypothetical protein
MGISYEIHRISMLRRRKLSLFTLSVATPALRSCGLIDPAPVLPYAGVQIAG